MDTGKIPKAWQLSTVIAILKGKEESSADSYRPITLTPKLAKFLKLLSIKFYLKKKVLMLIISL